MRNTFVITLILLLLFFWVFSLVAWANDKQELFNDPEDADIGNLSAPCIFYEKFNSLKLDKTKWRENYLRRWGFHKHGGVNPKMVSFKNGFAILEAHGDLYDGNIVGVGQKTRVGSRLTTKKKFASGRFEIKAKISSEPYGLQNAFAIYSYRAYRKGTDEYDKGILQGNIDRNGYVIKNHEITFEIFGPDYTSDLTTTFVGELPKEQTVVETSWGEDISGEFHIFRFDWHTGDKGETPRVEYYLDGKLVQTIYTTVPTKAGEFTILHWFAACCEGDPKFDKAFLYVDWVKITPFYEENDEY